MANCMEVTGLKKRYGEVEAVRGIDFTVPGGSLFAFLGVNGAGKSTTINILCSILKKDEGAVTINGFDLDREADKIRPTVGIVFQNTVLDSRLTVRDNLATRAALYGLRGKALNARLDFLRDTLDMGEFFNRPFGKLSGGQKRRADIARGLLHSPKTLFLDEPTTGLDPKSRQAVWNVVGRLKAETGMTVFLTTHYMEEAARADDVVIMDSGAIVAHGTPNELKNAYSGDYLLLYAPQDAATDKRLIDFGFAPKYERDRYRIKIESGARAVEFFAKFPAYAVDFELVKGDMDDVFLNATGRDLKEETL